MEAGQLMALGYIAGVVVLHNEVNIVSVCVCISGLSFIGHLGIMIFIACFALN